MAPTKSVAVDEFSDVRHGRRRRRKFERRECPRRRRLTATVNSKRSRFQRSVSVWPLLPCGRGHRDLNDSMTLNNEAYMVRESVRELECRVTVRCFSPRMHMNNTHNMLRYRMRSRRLAGPLSTNKAPFAKVKPTYAVPAATQYMPMTHVKP